MRTLAIDCSTEVCSAALFDGTELIDGRYEHLGRGHAERLIPMIAELPEKGKAERVVVALGPGSFTGVRVGIAAARALAFSWGAEISVYSTLALIAATARRAAGTDQPVAVAITGGHGEWFVQGFNSDGATLHALASLSPEEAAEQVKERLVAGTQAQALVDRRGSGQALSIWPDAREFHLLSAATLSPDVNPIYGRGPDAQLPRA